MHPKAILYHHTNHKRAMYDEGPTVQISMATSELKAYYNRWQGIFENVAKIFNKSFYNSKLVIIIYPFILSLPFMLIKPLRQGIANSIECSWKKIIKRIDFSVEGYPT